MTYGPAPRPIVKIQLKFYSSCPHKAEPHVVVPVARVDVVAKRGTQELRIVVPTTATNNAVRPGRGMQRVTTTWQFFYVFILHKLPHVSVHVKKSKE